MMRRWKASVILTGAVVLIIFSATVKHLGHSFGAYFFGNELGTRYGPDKTLLDVITYRHAVRDYLQLALGVETLAKFMIGFGIAKMGIIENIERYANRCTLVVAWIIFAVSFVLVVLASNVFTTKLNNYVGSLTYAITLLYCYYHFSHLRKVLQLLEPYGKCGLTNYSVQGITGVFVMGSFGLGLWRYDLMAVLVVSLVIYVLQAVFCYWWLKRYKYGPLEYLWRVGTERKLFALRRE